MGCLNALFAYCRGTFFTAIHYTIFHIMPMGDQKYCKHNQQEPDEASAYS
jgi:hypothetical protein